MRYQVRLSNRAAKDLDKLNRDTHQRVLHRLDQLAENPFDPRISSLLKNTNLHKSRVGGWRIIFAADVENTALTVVTIERRGQVYQRI